MKPLVSVIIPAYNAAEYLKEALESALSQTYPNVEIIVVDDGSIDETRDVVASYLKSDRVRYFYGPHKGLPAARNLGIQNAKGSYIALLDADDVFLPAKLEEQVRHLEECPRCDVSYCDLYHFFDKMPNALFKLRYRFYSGEKVLPNLLRYFFIAPLSAVMRKSVFDRFGYFDESIVVAEDLDFWLRVAYGGGVICFLPRVLGKLRLRAEGNIQELNRQPELKLMALNGVEKLYRRMNDEDRRRYWMRFYLAKYRFKVAFAYFLVNNKKKARTFMSLAVRDVWAGVFYRRLIEIFIFIFPEFFLGLIARFFYSLRHFLVLQRIRNPSIMVPLSNSSISDVAFSEPLVSVVIPAYNAEKFIEAAVRSVLKQTHKRLEIIVADDGSTDQTAEVIKRLAAEDGRVHYFCRENQGQSAARNFAICKAKGKYIAFLDADDLFLPQKLARQVEHLESHPQCGVSYSKILHFFEDNIGELYYFSVSHPSGYLFGELLRKNFINPLAVMLRKELLDRYGAFEPSFRRVDEQYLWLKLSYHRVKFCYLDAVLGYYRVHKRSLSNERLYFKETEEKFLELLIKIQSWMQKSELKRYGFRRLVLRTRARLFVGRLMAGRNIFARMLLTLYTMMRTRRLKKVQ